MTTKKKKTTSATTKKPPVADRIARGLQGFADALKSGLESGADKETVLKQFNLRTYAVNLEPMEYGPDEVKHVREKILHVSQAIFARFLGVSVKTVRAWEQGDNTPSDIAARFMDEIQSDPTYWQKKLSDHIRPKELAET